MIGLEVWKQHVYEKEVRCKFKEITWTLHILMRQFRQSFSFLQDFSSWHGPSQHFKGMIDPGTNKFEYMPTLTYWMGKLLSRSDPQQVPFTIYQAEIDLVAWNRA